MKKETEKPAPDLSPKLRRSKTREISSRFLFPTSSSDGVQSPNQALSPIRKKPISSSSSSSIVDANNVSMRKHRSEDMGLIKGLLWPSSNKSSIESNSSKKAATLADHLGNDRLKDLLQRKPVDGPQFLGRQRSCTEFSRFENSKENHHPVIGGSMRYTGKLRFPGKSSKKGSLFAGRLSVDDSSFNRRSSDSFLEIVSSESECSTDTANSKNSGSASFRRSGLEVSSRYLNGTNAKLRRGTSDSNIPTPVSDNSQSFSGLPPKNAVKRASSLKAESQWALSPGRSGSPPMSVESKGKPIMSFSNLRPPNSPSRSKGVGNFLSLGLDLFKSKKSSTNCLPAQLGHGIIGDNAHQLRLLQNRLLQWRYVNAKADDVNGKNTKQIENNLVHASANLTKLQSSVAQKRIQFGKEKLEFKLNNILGSELKSLESWGDMERQHLSAITTTKDCLHSVVCRVPLIEGAKVDPQPASLALRHASDLTASIKTMLIDFSPVAQRTGELLSELSNVAASEKLLLEECFELIGMVSTLEIQERNLRCSIIQLKSQQGELGQGRQQQAGVQSSSNQ